MIDNNVDKDQEIARLKSQVVALEQLLEVYEQTTLEQSDRLEQALRALTKRATELETAAQVSAAASTILEADKLLQEVVNLTESSFNLYHVHIYLLNEAGDTLILAAGASEVGRQMVTQGWSIPLEREQLPVAQAVRTRQGVIVNNVQEATDWLSNPLLSDTHSELAVPIIVGDRVLGVLDVQAEEIGHFSDEDVRIQSTLAAQVGVALQNARSFAEQQQTGFLLSKRVRELDCLNEIGRAIAEAPPIAELLEWVTERVPAAMQYPELCRVAIEYQGQLYGAAEAIKLETHMTNALRVGQEVLGRMYVAYRKKRDFLDEESALLGGIASRVSAYIESLRLVEQIQRRATELEDTQVFLDSIIENMPTALFVKEAQELKFVRWNKASETLFGFSREGIVGKNDYDFFPKEEADFFTAKDREVLAGGQLVDIPEEPIHTARQGLRFLHTTKVPILGADGQPKYLLGLSEDITERKQVEEALRASEARHRALLNAIPDLIMRVNADGVYLDVKPAKDFSTLIPPEQLIGKTSFEVLSLELAQQRQAYIEQALKTGETQLYEHQMEQAGRIAYREFRVIPTGENEVLMIVRDIGERKEAEEALRASEERFALAVAGTQDGIWDWDIKNSTLYWSPRLKEMLGYKPDEIEVNFDTFASFLHPEDAKTTGAALDAHLKHRTPYDVEQRLRAKSGEYIWFRVRGQAIWDEAGNPIRMTGSSIDITAEKAAVAEHEGLLAEVQRLAAIVENHPDFIGVGTLDGKALYVNPAGLRMMGLPPHHNVTTMDATHFYPAADTEKLIKEGIPAALKTGSWSAEAHLLRVDGTTVPVEETIGVNYDANSKPHSFSITMRDISERKATEVERERLLAEVEAAYRQYVHQEWKQFLGERHQGGWRIERQQNSGSSMSDEALAKVQAEVTREGKTKVVTRHNGHSTQPAVVAPIALRGQVIGTLSLQDIDPNRQWTAEEQALLETVSEQLALTIENLRLFDETQKRATREQLTRQITDKMRAAPDVDTIIQTGLAELAKALNVSRAYVKLTTPPEAEQSQATSNDHDQEEWKGDQPN